MLSESRASVTKKAWEQKNRDQRLAESKAHAKLQEQEKGVRKLFRSKIHVN